MGSNLVIRSFRVRLRLKVGRNVITVVLRPTSAQRLIKIRQGSGIIETDIRCRSAAHQSQLERNGTSVNGRIQLYRRGGEQKHCILAVFRQVKSVKTEIHLTFRNRASSI